MAGTLRPDPRAAFGHEGPLLRVQLGLHRTSRKTRPSSATPSLMRGARPDTSIQHSEKAIAAGKEAHTFLHHVIDEHPTTPWALLAERELKDPLGFKWMEKYVRHGLVAMTTRAASGKTRTWSRPSHRKCLNCRRIVPVRDGRHATWHYALRSSSDDDVYRLVGEDESAGCSPWSRAPAKVLSPTSPRPPAAPGFTAQTMVTDRSLWVSPGAAAFRGHRHIVVVNSAGSTAAADTRESGTPDCVWRGGNRGGRGGSHRRGHSPEPRAHESPSCGAGRVGESGCDT